MNRARLGQSRTRRHNMQIFDDTTIHYSDAFASRLGFFKRRNLAFSQSNSLGRRRKNRVCSCDLRRMDQRFAVHPQCAPLLSLSSQPLVIFECKRVETIWKYNKIPPGRDLITNLLCTS